jgi:hypothetical protein
MFCNVKINFEYFCIARVRSLDKLVKLLLINFFFVSLI